MKKLFRKGNLPRRAIGIGAEAMLLPLCANAEIVQLEDKMKFDIDPATHTATCTWILGSTSIYEGNITIPDQITWEGETYTVNKLGTNACINNASLLSLTLGPNITEIMPKAVYGSSKLAKVTMGNNLQAIGDSAFQNCTMLADFVCPESVKSIGQFSFQGCAFETFALPAGIQTIGINPFRSATKLKNITLDASNPNFTVVDGALFNKGVTEIISLPAGQGLTEYTVPSTVTAILPHSMRNNPTLEKINLPEGVLSIGSFAMGVNSKLTTIVIPASLQEFGAGAFYGDLALTNFQVAEGNTVVSFSNGFLLSQGGKQLEFSVPRSGAVLVPDGVETINDNVFYAMGLTSITFPNSVKNINQQNFYNCKSLESVTLGNSVEFIGKMCFQNCSALTTIKLPASMRTLDTQAFTYSGLQSIELNEGLSSIGSMCFYGNTSLQSLHIPSTVNWVGHSQCYNCTGLQKVSFAEGVTVIPLNFAYSAVSLSDLTLPSTLEDLGAYSFSFCENLTSVTLPEGLKYMRSTCLQCTGIKQITVPAGVAEIEEFALASCPNLRKVTTVPGALRILGDNAIHNCGSLKLLTLAEGLDSLSTKSLSLNGALTSMTMPSSMKHYGEFCINFCTAMTDLYLLNPEPAVMYYDLYDPETYAFPGYEKVTLHVPEGTAEAYRQAPIWEKFENIVEGGYPGEVKGTDVERSVAAEYYFDLNGYPVTVPQPGTVCIKRTLFTDGTSVTSKVMTPENADF